MSEDKFLTGYSWLEEDAFSVSDMSKVTDVKENTLRTWLSRYFKERGTKQGNKRVRYSFLDCLDIRIFAEIVQSLSVTPDAAKIAAMVCGERHRALLKRMVNPDEISQGGSYYFVFKVIRQSQIMFEPVSLNNIAAYISDNSDEPFVFIPVDHIFLSTQKKILDLVGSRVKAELVKEESPAITSDNISKIYKLGFKHEQSRAKDSK